MLYLEIMTLRINNNILIDGFVKKESRLESRDRSFARMQDADHHVRWHLSFKNMKIPNRQNSRTEARKSIANGVTNERLLG